MTKAESAASKTPRMDAALDAVAKLRPTWIVPPIFIDHARTLELEAAALRDLNQAEFRERERMQARINGLEEEKTHLQNCVDRAAEIEAALRERLGTEMAGKEALLICIQTACEVLGEQVQPAFLPDLIEERMAKAREEAIEECAKVAAEEIEKYSGNSACALHVGNKLRALTQKGKIEKQHQWSDDGERCIKCGDKDWMGGPCNG